jgi:PEP-CTERM motif
MVLSRLVWGPTLPLLLFAVLALPASAQDLVLYPFSTNLNPTVVAASVTPALGLATLSNSFIGDDGFGNVLEAYPTAGSTSAALALANNSFFTLTLSVTPGTFGPVVVNFNAGKGGSSDPRGFLVRTSLDGFASNVLSQTLPSGTQQAPAPQSFSLNLSGQSAVTLRFYVWTPFPAANSVDFRDLEVAGSVSATPLPPTWSLALIGLAAAGLYFEWRRRTASVN